MKNDEIEKNSFLYSANAVYIEELYQKYLQNNSSVSLEWQDFFANNSEFQAFIENKPKWLKKTVSVINNNVSNKEAPKQINIENTSNHHVGSWRAKFMIEAYRNKGHFLADLDPLGLFKPFSRNKLNLNLADFGFDESNSEQEVEIEGEYFGLAKARINELYNLLNKTYSNKIGYEFAHIENTEEKAWLYKQVEEIYLSKQVDLESKKQILNILIQIESFEQYLHVKFPGAKRFSIEGGEAAIAALELMIEKFADSGATDIVLGMAHRGRLSTLTKVMGKSYAAVFSEFLGRISYPEGLNVAGDVKYHHGYSSDRVTAKNNKIHLSLTANPSHLEAVNPVVAGKVRAKQDIKNDVNREKTIGILIHGDAAFCGQGVVAETLSYADLKPYHTGGTVHIVINNQIGFTANSFDSRQGRYATDIAKIIEAPIIHINGESAEDVYKAVAIAVDYKNKFKRDIVLDIICYRKYGHNEGDEPMFTQPEMYNIIKKKNTPAKIFADLLASQKLIAGDFYDETKAQFKKYLDEQYNNANSYEPEADWLSGLWQNQKRAINSENIFATGVKLDKLLEIGKKICQIPEDFNVNSKVARLLKARSEILENKKDIDWATAEQLAFASLLNDKLSIRITGQDSCRGTFSHRHAVLKDQKDFKKEYIPLQNLHSEQGNFEVADSNLSEYAVLGFEYGYSTVDPNNLVIWEAQFGDFANGAQIIFDQFISSAETKWLRMSGLVCLLPHGYEGQGPEHSSARLERFLQLAAENNIQVAYPTTPASIFHLLRRQVLRDFRKPLIIMSPKSILRHKFATSKLDDLAENTQFKTVLDDQVEKSKIRKLIFCSGKVFYDLHEYRLQQNIDNIAIIRLEQLYPFPQENIKEILQNYKNVTSITWCQEEPKNMGAWFFINPYFEELEIEIKYVGRKAAASTAVGYSKLHNDEQNNLVKQALEIGE